MATERTPLQQQSPARSERDEYGFAYVDDDAGDADDADDNEEDGRARSASRRSDYFRQSDHELLSEQAAHKQRTAAYTAYTLLMLLVLFFVWSSTQSAASVPAAGAGAAVTNHDDFFCGLKDFETGYVKLANKKDDHYFYWYIPSTSGAPEKDPLVLWLTGGPGVASTVALLSENGPCLVQPDLTTTLNEYAWTNAANVIWLDQPTNVGYSYGLEIDADSTTAEVGENIYWFLQGFLDRHPELQDRAFFIAGESYGGHYVPAAAHYITKRQHSTNEGNAPPIAKRINLQGIAIGNGLVDAAIQFPHYIDMADNVYNVTFVNTSQRLQMQALASECERRILVCQDNGTLCVDAQAFCESNLDEPFTSGSQRNPFDIRKSCDAADAQTCNSMDHIAEYLNLPSVRSTLLGTEEEDRRAGVWKLLNEDVHATFIQSGDFLVSYSAYVAELLNRGIRVLVYAGDADLACNWLGNQAWTRALDWEGRAGFDAADEQLFVTKSGVTAGVFRTFASRFTFLRVFNAGHMVPQDQPGVAFEMIDRFLNNLRL